ncbi:porin family protein [Vibrio sp. EA2]|uniref:porin family protein n=1 Tax=Vibrio sp. EA2 TaxID=3079860 RepID=UPI00294A859D|nr:porin family protein [Vibrio sp. EA2]MDV6251715.1 porin family protein [Vibrio sp. EA2]
MRNKFGYLVGSILMSIAVNAQANITVTPFIGYTAGGQVEDESANTYDIDAAANYALAIETPFLNGKVGLFYSYQPTELKELSNSADIHYLQFQSSLSYPIAQGWQTYAGLGIGGSYNDVDWADKKVGFSASAFAGIEYEYTKAFALTAQLRWLGTVVDNDTSGACTLPSDGSNCVIKYDTDWMNQFQSNVGISFRF